MAYISHFCTRKHAGIPPVLPILPLLHSSDSHSVRERNTYWILGTLVATILGAFVAVLSLPMSVGAFWPFTSTEASEGGTGVILHDPRLALLDSPTNSDPKAQNTAHTIVVSQDSALVAYGGPEGSATNESMGNGGRISLYTVREGDALSEIAEMFGVSVNTILWANDIKNAKTIQPGDTLLILPVSGVRHIVVKGDTLASIAKKYDADAADIALYNGLDEDVKLVVDSTLIVPGGEVPAPKKSVASSSGASKSHSSTLSAGLPAISGFYANPVPGARLTQGLHGWNGVDLGAPSGTPVYASAAGQVIVAKMGGYNGGYGNYVVIDHGNGTQTLYAHLSGVSIGAGVSVEQGARIGAVGNTGRSTGYHLHFEVRGAKNPFAR